ncbi:hypothetical protein JIN84_06835 [Luteolibacter yonseiensis]|uniref:Uncharacterized protein n=1 Tax=Luteolibacter yonseiensis TaxID=1144680 RepID=A0A934R1P4_9BACT|nr:hypothetical protein [Luteolibacter yonseiensis]MBK1815321.1 hypothetical protein [Luteolibacter yonseiensis]
MKRLRSFLIPVFCFSAAWAVSSWVGKHGGPSATGESPDHHGSSARRTPGGFRKISAEKLAEDFLARPTSEWARLWEEFAVQADADDLQKISRLPPPGAFPHHAVVRELLQSLACEALAVRGGHPVILTPGAFSALAERDPEAAWRSIEGNNRSDFASAALRILAGKDPAETLRRFQGMPESGTAPPEETHRRERTYSTPLGSIFGAWARRDPTAAAAALKDLPPNVREAMKHQVATVWAFQDGPAAIRYLLDSDQANGNILRASFRTHPGETAGLMDANATLRKAMEKESGLYAALGPWAEADPDRVTTWLLESSGDAGQLAVYLYFCIGGNVGSAGRIIRGLAAAGVAVKPSQLRGIYRQYPASALSLADELGIDLSADPQIRQNQILNEPEVSCERWLTALRDEQGDPEKALASLGWKKETATELAARAARVFPEKAAALAKALPASALDTTNLWRGNNKDIARYWPELAPFLDYPVSPGDTPAFQETPFHIDPVAAADGLLQGPLSDGDVRKIIGLLGEYDPAAARSWVARLPDPGLRQSGGLALATIEASTDPAAALDFLTRNSINNGRSETIWETSLTRLLVTGGDWKGWLDKMPGGNLDRLRHVLATQSQVLESARRTAGE